MLSLALDPRHLLVPVAQPFPNMTPEELIEVQADHDILLSLQSYRAVVNDGTDQAVVIMRQSTSVYEGLGDTIQAAWLAAVDTKVAEAQNTFDSFVGTDV